MSVGPSEPHFLVTERQLRSLRSMYALGDGWPFGDGPMLWFCHFDLRLNLDLEDPPEEAHIVCDQCSQSIFCLAPNTDHRGFTWNLELLKSRIADHVLKCHPEAAT